MRSTSEDANRRAPAPGQIRMTTVNFDPLTTAPDGSHRFTPGLIVAVGERVGQVAPDTARRWCRIGIAEPFEGVAGTTVSNDAVAKTPAELDAEIENLLALRERARGGTRITREGSPGEPTPPATVPSDDPYHDPEAAKPFPSLTEKQRRALELAGFTRQAHVDNATDEELLAALGASKGSEAALAALRAPAAEQRAPAAEQRAPAAEQRAPAAEQRVER